MSADVELKPGTLVTSNVRLVRPLSSGAMGSVWVAKHQTLDTEVAVKFIHKSLPDDDEQLRQRFSLEAKAAARIKSPHVVQVFDQGLLADGRPFIVMELLDGESLADRLERAGWLPAIEAAQIVHETCKALTRAHGLGIVHRDIKPENIFLCRADEGFFVKLLDFGIAKHGQMPEGSKLTGHGVMVGTAEYMSREQVMSSRDVDHHADLWAVAVVAYEMLTGDVPFTGETLGMICLSVCNGKYTPASQKRKELSPRLDVWFARAFATEPKDRFRTARELSQAFRRILGVDEAFDSESGEIPISKVGARPERPTPVTSPTPPAVETPGAPASDEARASDEPPDDASVDASVAATDASVAATPVASPPPGNADDEPPADDFPEGPEGPEGESRVPGGGARPRDERDTSPGTTLPVRRGPSRALWFAAAALIAGAVGLALVARPSAPSTNARVAAGAPVPGANQAASATRPTGAPIESLGRRSGGGAAEPAPPSVDTAASDAGASAIASAGPRHRPARPARTAPAAGQEPSAAPGPSARPNYGF